MPSGIIPIIAYTHRLRKDGQAISVISPIEVRIRNIFIKNRWSAYLEGIPYDARDSLTNMPLLHVSSENGVLNAVDCVIDIIMQSVPGLPRGNLQALEWSLNEVLDNVFNHAESRDGAFIQAVKYTRRRIVDFVVCDTGIGIPKSMQSLQIFDPGEALIESIREGVTSKKGMNKGNGLYGTYSIARESQTGHFAIHSDFTTLFFDRKRSAALVTRESTPFRGTLVHWAVSVDEPNLIERSLIFRGQQHQISFDYLEKKFSPDDDTIIIRVKDYRGDLGTRAGGKRFRTLLENVISEGGSDPGPVILDFVGVSIITSSFADEVFAKIAQEHGRVWFSSKISIQNADMTIKALIAREIDSRLH